MYPVAFFLGAATVDLVSVMLRPLVYSGVLMLTVRHRSRASLKQHLPCLQGSPVPAACLKHSTARSRLWRCTPHRNYLDPAPQMCTSAVLFSLLTLCGLPRRAQLPLGGGSDKSVTSFFLVAWHGAYHNC